MYYGFAYCPDCNVLVLHFVYGKLQEDYVEVILSGEEQFDKRVTLYFDGSVDMTYITPPAD